jgi:hypothetical protein
MEELTGMLMLDFFHKKVWMVCSAEERSYLVSAIVASTIVWIKHKRREWHRTQVGLHDCGWTMTQYANGRFAPRSLMVDS